MSQYDVIVAGGGLSGVAAAIAASRGGARVLLIEQYGFLGGMATAGLVNPFMNYNLDKEYDEASPKERINNGIFGEILDTLKALGGLHTDGMTFSEEHLKLVLDRMVTSNGITVLFHTFIMGVEKDNGTIKSITVVNKEGTKSYSGKYFVDATGDADLSALSGCSFKIGRDEDNGCQPMTLCFRLANVNTNVVAPTYGALHKEPDRDRKLIRESIDEKYREFQKQGLIKNPREDVLTFPHMVEDVIHFNSTRIIKKLPFNSADFSKAEMEAREQAFELYNFMKENIAGFENSKFLMSATQIGVRESRRIVGEYVITAEDLLSTHKFEDSIARGNYPIDIHNPSGSGTVMMKIPSGDYYTIPYRALVPQDMKNLIVAGRPISSTHEAHSAYRVMPICTCIGEGAGSAIAVALKDNCTLKKVDIGKVHQLLDKWGGLY